MRNLPRPVRQAAAVALLAIPPLLVWALLVGPWLAARTALAARLDVALAAESRAVALASRGPALREEAEALRLALTGVADAVPGASYALAGAELQRRLRDAIGRRRGTVQSIETLPEGRAGTGVVAVAARLQTDAEGLQGLLEELEAGRALLQVHALGVAPAGVGARRPLGVQLEVRGVRREESSR